MDLTKEDLMLVAGKSLLGAFPGIGPFLSGFIELAQANIGNKRLRSWMAMMEDQFQKLNTQQQLNDLASNEFFYSCVQRASVGAMHSFQNEKREYFANALYNSIVLPLGEDKIMLFFNLLDRQTIGGLHLLKYYSESHYNQEKNTHRSNMVSITKFPGTERPITSIVANNPKFDGDVEYIKTLTSQLMGDGLIHLIELGSLEHPQSPDMARKKCTTKLGDDFLQFISDGTAQE